MYNEDQGLIKDLESWKSEYRKDKTKVWVIVTLSNNVTYFFKDYEDWYTIIDIAHNNNLYVEEVGLRYRSNIYRKKVSGEGLYIIRSALGSPGSETIDTMTIGTVEGDFVLKDIIQLPALIVMNSHKDKLSECTPEVILMWENKK